MEWLRKTNNQLEFLRKIHCLGQSTIEDVFESNDKKFTEHMINKYINCREQYGQYGNFAFVFQLDNNNAHRLFSFIGVDECLE